MNNKRLFNGMLVFGLVLSVVLFAASGSPALASDEDAPAALPASERLDPDNPTGDVDPIARRIRLLQKDREHDEQHKVLLTNIMPGQVVSHYIVEGTDTSPFDQNGEPSGSLAGSKPGSADGKPIEFFAPMSDTLEGPAAKMNNYFLWSEAGGWELLESVIVTPSSGESVF